MHDYAILLPSSLFINTALMLWAFNMSNGPSRQIDPNALTDEMNVYPPVPYAAAFTPRVDEPGELLRRKGD